MSIRSGKGSATHDRVLRLLPVFDSADEAARFALGEGLAYLKQPPYPAADLPSLAGSAA